MISFKFFMLFMVKSRCILAGYSNPGMLLALQVSLSLVNRTVRFGTLERCQSLVCNQPDRRSLKDLSGRVAAGY